MDSERRPCHDVEVGFDFDYLSTCTTFSAGREHVEKWLDLGDRLAARKGWHFDVTYPNGALWSLGAFGASLLNISIDEKGTFYCFDYAEDEGYPAHSLDDVERWLSDREARASEIPARSRLWLQEEGWRLLLQRILDVRVSWAEGMFFAHVHDLPEPPVMADDLSSVLAALRQMVCAALDAPSELARQLKLGVRLDAAAAEHLEVG